MVSHDFDFQALVSASLLDLFSPHMPDHFHRVPRLGGSYANSFHVHVQSFFTVSISII